MSKYPAVYVYVHTQDNGMELRHSLRSLKNIRNWDGRVFVVGDKEDWFKNIRCIRLSRRGASPQQDVENKMMRIIASPEIPDGFILMNDDIYVTKPSTVEPLHGGEMKEGGAGYYNKAKDNTRKLLLERGIEHPLRYGIHVPMIMNKQKRLKVHALIERSLRSTPLLARDLYGNIFNLGGERYVDRKTKTNQLKSGRFISTSFYTDQLAKIFPDACEFESDGGKPTVHMIWLGSRIPRKYALNVRSYQQKGYSVKVWTVPPRLVNQRLFNAAKSYALKADIMRLEILYQYGGIYTDIDSRMLSHLPITEDLMCMTSASGYCGNETIYATKGHPALKEIIDGMESHVEGLKGTLCNIWDIAGATYITPIFSKYNHVKMAHSHIGGRRHRPRIIQHQYAGSWTGGRAKSEKRNLNEWINV